MQDHLNEYISIIENIYDNTKRSNSVFFGNIMLRFFITNEIECPGKFNKLKLLSKLNEFRYENKTKFDGKTCISKNHVGDNIIKNYSLGGYFNYTDSLKIERNIKSPIGTYDKTGVSIIFYRKE